MGADAASLWVVITDFNGWEQTRRCLAALQQSRARGFRVLVVDHGTTTDTHEGLRSAFPEAIRLRADPELWWTGAINRGIRHALDAGASAVMLLNNDCYVAPDTIGTLLRVGADHPGAVIAPVQRRWPTGETLSVSPRSLFLLGFPSLRGPSQVSAEMRAAEAWPVALIVGGRGVIIPREVFGRNGLFDEEHLPHYGSDHDFYLRARANGIALLAATQAFVDVDPERTSEASDPGRLTLREFLETLRSARSHRNIRDVTELFRRHYPLRHLHWLGVMLYTARYAAVYAVRRMRFLIQHEK